MLFGHQNDDGSQGMTAEPADGVNPLAVDPITGASLPAVPPPPATPDEPSVLAQPASPAGDDPTAGADTPSYGDPSGLPVPPSPMPDPDTAPTEPSGGLSLPAPVDDTPKPEVPFSSFDSPAPASRPGSNASAAANDDLLGLKQQALSQLDPLVDHLDQTPEEKFRTTMMLIQSTDNPSRLQAAYDAAQAITDEKARAQALLDVVNEINYFTQSKQAE